MGWSHRYCRLFFSPSFARRVKDSIEKVHKNHMYLFNLLLQMYMMINVLAVPYSFSTNMDICTYAIKSELSKNCVAHPLSEILRTYHIFTYHYTKSLADFFMYKQVQLPALLCNYDRPNGRLFIQGVPCSLPHPLVWGITTDRESIMENPVYKHRFTSGRGLGGVSFTQTILSAVVISLSMYTFLVRLSL